MLWSQSSPRAGGLAELPHWPVASGRLHLALAVVALTPRNTIGAFPVTYALLGEHSFDALLAEACENLAAKMRVDGGDGDVFSLSGTLIAAAVCLPEFYRRLAELTNSARLVVGLPGPDEIHVAAAGSPAAVGIHQVVQDSECPTAELVPAVLAVEGDHIEVLFEKDVDT